jgi:uncharacterized membrane protein
MSNEVAELKKEFELERMILFSDAVFAIAITLLIIEIKFPEIHNGASIAEIASAFKPVIIRFIGFALSFFFIGMMWARHLEIFKYLTSYNNAVIFRNLLFIFFIVCFPFTASGLTENIRPGFYLPLFIYMINIACVLTTQFVLCHYLFNKPNDLTVPGNEALKKYQLLKSKYFTIVLWIVIGVLLAGQLVFPAASQYTLQSFFIVPLLLAFIKRRLRKYKLQHKIA